MERHGFIRDILDVKMLILYVMNLVETPVSAQTIYELCYQDECLSYFDVQEAIPQMVVSGHLQEENGLYIITEKGREAEADTSNAVAFPVRHRASMAVAQLNRKNRREQFLHCEIKQQGENLFAVQMKMDDTSGPLMNLEIMAPTMRQARKLQAAYMKNAEIVYKSVMIGLLEEEFEEEMEE